MDIQCCALFLTEQFGVPNNISSAIMRSDLVFDKALILNSWGQSSDVRVYAAGNISKINRSTLLARLGTNSQYALQLPLSPVLLTQDPIKPVVSWSLYSPHETAQYATVQMLQNRLEPQPESGLVPEFSRPLILNAKITKGFIFRVSRPLRDLRDQRIFKLFKAIETGDLAPSADGLRRWCRLEIDPLGIVDSFTVYSGNKLEEKYADLVFRIVGLPVALFDQLEARWSAGEVNDLLDFFCKPQVQALLTNEVEQKINEVVLDTLYSQDFDPSDVLQNVPDGVRSLADVKEGIVAREIGYDVLKKQRGASEIFRRLVHISQGVADQLRERFSELDLAPGRGRVDFE